MNQQYLLVVSTIRGRSLFTLYSNDTGTPVDTGVPGWTDISNTNPIDVQLNEPGNSNTFTINVSTP